MALTPVQWENEQQTPQGGEGKLTLFMNVLEGSFADASFFNFKNVTTLFPITVPIFPHTRLSKHWDQGTFISESASFGGWMAVIKPGNHYIPLARKLKLMPLPVTGFLFFCVFEMTFKIYY